MSTTARPWHIVEFDEAQTCIWEGDGASKSGPLVAVLTGSNRKQQARDMVMWHDLFDEARAALEALLTAWNNDKLEPEKWIARMSESLKQARAVLAKMTPPQEPGGPA